MAKGHGQKPESKKPVAEKPANQKLAGQKPARKPARTAANAGRVESKPQEKKYCECGGVLQRVFLGTTGKVKVGHICGSCNQTYGKLKPTRFGCA